MYLGSIALDLNKRDHDVSPTAFGQINTTACVFAIATFGLGQHGGEISQCVSVDRARGSARKDVET